MSNTPKNTSLHFVQGRESNKNHQIQVLQLPYTYLIDLTIFQIPCFDMLVAKQCDAR